MKGLVFTYLLTYGGSLCALFNPLIGLEAYTCFAIIKPDGMWFWMVPQGNYSRTLALAMLVGWGFKRFGSWQLWRAWPVVLALLGFLGWTVLSAMLAPNSTVAWGDVEALLKIVAPFLVGVTMLNSHRQLKRFAWVLLLSQGYVALEMNLSYFSGYNRAYEDGFGGLDNNSLAITMVSAVGLGFFLGLHANSWWKKALAFAATALMVHCILFTFSRGGMLALAVSGCVAFWLLPKEPKHYLLFAILLLAGLRLAGPQVKARFFMAFEGQEHRDASSQSRLDLWADCWDCMRHNPVLGLGPGHWTLVAHEYGWPPGKEAHSLWMQMGAELGFPGVGFLAAFYMICIGRLWPLARRPAARGDPGLRIEAAMVVTSLIGFCISAQFVTVDTVEIPYYVCLVGAVVLKLASAPAINPLTILATTGPPFHQVHPALAGRLVSN